MGVWPWLPGSGPLLHLSEGRASAPALLPPPHPSLHQPPPSLHVRSGHLSLLGVQGNPGKGNKMRLEVCSVSIHLCASIAAPPPCKFMVLAGPTQLLGDMYVQGKAGFEESIHSGH